MKSMRVETHQIKKNHELYDFCDRKCFESKNLYNKGNYILRQRFTEQEGYNKDDFNCTYFGLNSEFKTADEYKVMGSNFSEGILKVLSQDWKSFFSAIKDYKKKPHKYNNRPNLPGYAVAGEKGRKVAIDRRINRRKDGSFKFAGENVYFTPQTNEKLKQARIVPKPFGNTDNITHYNIEIVYEIEVPELTEENNNIAGIDIGLNNLATIVTNTDTKPIVINGKPLKSMNQYYNKKKAKLMNYVGDRGTSNRIRKLTKKRNNKIKTYIHKSSRKIVEWCKEHEIDTIIIGNNKDWKKEINIGKVNNQHFVNIPFKMLINQIEYKAEEYGIEVIITEESYTSKASFLDNDNIPKYGENDSDKFSGKRVKRGLYKSSDDTLINADVNGAYNIIRKVFPNKIDNNIDYNLMHPKIINIA